VSGLESRPFVGTWQSEGQTIVQHTPDCVVTINGYTEIPGCPSCNGRIEIQKYITQVTVDPTLEPPSTATVSLFIPSVDNQFFFRDGDFLLKPGLEIRIYMRGYFPQKFLTREDADRAGVNSPGFDPSQVPVYPYYHVFHGVVTEASHEYSSGDYTASLTCSDTLHFWETLKISTNGSVFGVRPDNSLVDVTYYGHTFQGASPYSIIYTLFRVGFGATGGVEFNFDVATNVAASSAALGMSLYKAAALYWENRWSSQTLNLKMYGADGTIYNAFEQAYLGAFEGKNPEVSAKASSRPNGTDKNTFDVANDPKVRKLIRDLGFNPLSTRVSLATSVDGKKLTSIDVTKMQAFVYDVSILGNISVFETEYATKIEIAQAVKEVTGFEFYQDVDGDLVFKPPFYNMDTSTDPVYVIEDRDLISVSEASREPDATMVKVKGSQLHPNLKIGLEEWLLPTAVFIDYRLVAQFGWREGGPFECNYLTDTRSLYVSAINRLDLLNAGMKSASISIPLRPELKLGYPVYIRYLDCFYYISGLSHAFAYGGQCTTTITGVAKRAKFNAPGIPAGTREPSVEDTRLDNLYLPSIPLSIPTNKYAPASKSSEGAAASAENQITTAAGPRRFQGFPNVVMAIDAQKVKTDSLLNLTTETPNSIIQAALDAGILIVAQDAEGETPEQKRYTGPYLLLSSNEGEGQRVTKQQLIEDFDEENKTVNPTSALGRVIESVRSVTGVADRSFRNYLNLIKNERSSYAPGTSLTGSYRYYSCSHPNPFHQGVTPLLVLDNQGNKIEVPGGPLSASSQVDGFNQNGGFGPVAVESGIPIQIEQPAEDGGEGLSGVFSVMTKDIFAVSFMQNFSVRSVSTSKEVQNGIRGIGTLVGQASSDIISFFADKAATTDPSQSLTERFGETYDIVAGYVNEYFMLLGETGLVQGANFAVDADFGAFIAAVNDETGSSIDASLTLEENATPLLPPGEIYDDETTATTFAGNISSYLTDQNLIPVSETYQKALALLFSEDPYDKNALQLATDIRGFTAYLVANLEGTSADDVEADLNNELVEGDAFFFEAGERKDFTPVYPISDAAGYEVYGSFPYGRGLTASTFFELMRGPQNLDVRLLTNQSNATSATFGAIERFLAKYREASPDTTYNQIYDTLGADDQRQLSLISEADNVYRPGSDPTKPGSLDLDKTLSKLSQNPKSQYSVLASNVPVELATLTIGEDQICSCKTSDAQTYLLAAALDPNSYDPITKVWIQNKDAYAGATLDGNSRTWAQLFEPFQEDSAKFFANPAIAAAQEAVASVGEIAAIADAIRRNTGNEG